MSLHENYSTACFNCSETDEQNFLTYLLFAFSPAPPPFFFSFIFNKLNTVVLMPPTGWSSPQCVLGLLQLDLAKREKRWERSLISSNHCLKKTTLQQCQYDNARNAHLSLGFKFGCAHSHCCEIFFPEIPR